MQTQTESQDNKINIEQYGSITIGQLADLITYFDKAHAVFLKNDKQKSIDNELLFNYILNLNNNLIQLIEKIDTRKDSSIIDGSAYNMLVMLRNNCNHRIDFYKNSEPGIGNLIIYSIIGVLTALFLILSGIISTILTGILLTLIAVGIGVAFLMVMPVVGKLIDINEYQESCTYTQISIQCNFKNGVIPDKEVKSNPYMLFKDKSLLDLVSEELTKDIASEDHIPDVNLD